MAYETVLSAVPGVSLQMGSSGMGDDFALVMMGVMFLFWTLVLIALGIGIYWGVTRLTGDDGEQGRASTDDPLRILNERYARDELSTEEYEQRKRAITEENTETETSGA